MTPAEIIYRVLLRLYPRDHRHAYGRFMLQHARDQERAARMRGRRHVALLYLRLIGDGVANAAAEHWYALRTSGRTFKPAPWPAVLMAAIPGLGLALTRRYADVLGPALSILGIVYILLLVFVPPLVWRRTRQIPVWTLIPLGMLTWLLIYQLGTALASPALPLSTRVSMWAIVMLLNLALAAAIFTIMLRGRHFPTAALVVVALLLLGGLLLALYLNQSGRWNGRHFQDYLAVALTGPAEALMLVAVGLLAARKHNVLALLVIIGGYAYMFSDSDYLWISPYRDWPGLSIYLLAVTFLFLVLAPAGLLRAKTRLGRAVALFVPAVLFLVARLAVPALVLGQAARIRPGDVLISANILLSLILGWILYSHLGHATYEVQPDTPQLSV